MLESLSVESRFLILLPLHVIIQSVFLYLSYGLLLTMLDCICKCYDCIINLRFLDLIVYIMFIYIIAFMAGCLIYGSIVGIIDAINDCIYLSKLTN